LSDKYKVKLCLTVVVFVFILWNKVMIIVDFHTLLHDFFKAKFKKLIRNKLA